MEMGLKVKLTQKNLHKNKENPAKNLLKGKRVKVVVPEEKLTLSSGEFKKTDIYIYSGPVDLSGAEKLIRLTQEASNENVLMILCTYGGDLDAAFKIARRFQEKYKKFTLFVGGYCKSAGTLIAIGADEIIMSEFAEFGPLDIQLPEKKDEVWRYGSGLNINEALITLKDETLSFFKSILMELVNTGMSTKTAAELAVTLSTGLMSPIVSQVDPIRLGEIKRATKIALAYGARLMQGRGNLNSFDELVALVQGYPDHGFVIDFKEAQKVFKNIRSPIDYEITMEKRFEDVIRYPEEQKLIEKIHLIEEGKSERINKPANSKSPEKRRNKTTKPNKVSTGKIASIKPS